jgi:hypothetical protein
MEVLLGDLKKKDNLSKLEEEKEKEKWQCLGCDTRNFYGNWSCLRCYQTAHFLWKCSSGHWNRSWTSKKKGGETLIQFLCQTSSCSNAFQETTCEIKLLDWSQYVNSLILEKSIVMFGRPKGLTAEELLDFRLNEKLAGKLQEMIISLAPDMIYMTKSVECPIPDKQLYMEICLKPCETQLLRIWLIPFSIPNGIINLIANYYDDNKGSLLCRKMEESNSWDYQEQMFNPQDDSVLFWSNLRWLRRSKIFSCEPEEGVVRLTKRSFSLNYKNVKQILDGEMTGKEIKRGRLDKTWVWIWDSSHSSMFPVDQITTEIVTKTKTFMNIEEDWSPEQNAAIDEVHNELSAMIQTRIKTCCPLCLTWILQFHFKPTYGIGDPYRVWLHCKCDFERLETIWTMCYQANEMVKKLYPIT